MGMFLVNEPELWNVADQSQETLLFFDWLVLNLNFGWLSTVLVWPSQNKVSKPSFSSKISNVIIHNQGWDW
jgi:hypothetical protein